VVKNRPGNFEVGHRLADSFPQPLLLFRGIGQI
jgi:hypothetical protein